MKAAVPAILALALALALAACATANRDRETADRAEPPLAPDPECIPPGYHFALVGTDTTVYRQGATVRVTPKVDVSPAGTLDLPLRCTRDWSVEGPATLSADRTSVAIAADAPPGSTVILRFRHDGKPVEARFKVVGRDEIVLTGQWSQQSLEGCAADEPVRELVFAPEHRFAVTFMPLETYQDYWGTYSFDPATGALRLTVEGGNFVPSNLDLDGAAELAGGRLRLRGFFLGSRDDAPRSECTYVF
jgi:hypothetical protein